MQIRIASSAAALAVAAIHADATELAPLSIERVFLVFDFGACGSLSEARESIRTMDAYLAQQIAESDDGADIAALSLLKRQVVGIEQDVVREFAYKTRTTDSAEATTPDAESQLHGEQHASINDSSSSNGASLAEKEVVNGTSPEAEQQPRPRSRRQRG